MQSNRRRFLQAGVLSQCTFPGHQNRKGHGGRRRDSRPATVSIDSVIDKKLDALTALESQFYEGGALGSADLIPSDPEKQEERRRQVRENHAKRNQLVAQRYRGKLAEWYGKDKADKVQHAEVFEICEYGGRPDKKDLARLFPFFDE